jgi:HPt (histidine-containing phosphotransfer) domain-containing protein
MRRTKLILSAFLESYQGPIEKLRNSAQEISPHELIIPTHSIKGLLLDVGAKEAARLATSMENALKAGDIQTALDLRDNLTHCTDTVANLIERLLHDFPMIEVR